MITLTVITFNGAAVGQRLSASFDELGGTIGRADNNQLVLPDPERTISRVHAQVVFRAGRFAVVDRGSNPIEVNGRVLSSGGEAPLGPGDEIQIGGYGLRVELPVAGSPSPAPVHDDPFAMFSPAAELAPAARGGASANALSSAPASAQPHSPFGMDDPFAATPFAAKPASGANASKPPVQGIPDDWDPFGPVSVAKPPSSSAGRAAPQGDDPFASFGLSPSEKARGPLAADLNGLQRPAESSIDAMFDLGSAKGVDPFADPFANSSFSAPLAQPNTSSDADPLRAFSNPAQAAPAPVMDSSSDLNAAFIAPRREPAARPAPAPSPAPFVAPPVAAPRSPLDPILSWDSQPPARESTIIAPIARASRGARSMPFAAAPVAAPAPLPPAFAPAPGSPPIEGISMWADEAVTTVAPSRASRPAPLAPLTPATPSFDTSFDFAPARSVDAPPPAAPAYSASPVTAPVASMPPSATTRAATSAIGPSDQAELLAALLDGLRMPGLQIQSLTPDLMHLIGQLLRESTAGTVDMLVARSVLKREIRAELTMIKARENNPLKFSPTAEVALNHLLNPPTAGFMSGGPAMRDAYNDLRAHQFGMLAGMRAALDGVLKRFDPAVLETRLGQKSVLASLLPATRKARLWELFNELYEQLSAEANDDFHELFGKAFLRAYEAHVDELEKDAS
ncbi:hypothetical protein BH11PSE9_BH11PSE9_38130 [soil metagenome]